MNELELYGIKPEENEETVKTYSALPAPNTNTKNMLIASLLTVTGIAFLICFGFMIFLDSDIRKGYFAYDSTSYWVVVAVIISALIVLLLTCIMVCLAYHYLRRSEAKIASKSILYLLTNRAIYILNKDNKTVIDSVRLADVDEISRYVSEQLKVMTYEGKNIIIKVDDISDFIDRYPGLLRSERQRTRKASEEATH